MKFALQLYASDMDDVCPSNSALRVVSRGVVLLQPLPPSVYFYNLGTLSPFPFLGNFRTIFAFPPSLPLSLYNAFFFFLVTSLLPGWIIDLNCEH